MLFCFILELRKCSNFYSLNAVFKSFPPHYSCFAVIQLYSNHDQWMRLIFDTVNDVSRFKGSNTARPRFLPRHDVTDPKV